MIPVFDTCAGASGSHTVLIRHLTVIQNCAVFFQWKFMGRRACPYDSVEISGNQEIMISVHLGFPQRASRRIDRAFQVPLTHPAVANPTIQLAQFPDADVNRCAARR
jgi:hypothetical protein